MEIFCVFLLPYHAIDSQCSSGGRIICVFTSNQIKEPSKHVRTLFDRAFPLVHIYPRNMSADVHQKLYEKVHIAALFIIAANWKQLRCHQQRDG